MGANVSPVEVYPPNKPLSCNILDATKSDNIIH